MKWALALAFVLTVAAGPSQAGSSDDARRLCDDWAAGMNNGAVDGVAGRLDKESELLVLPDRVNVKGPAAARTYLADLFAKYRVKFRFTRRTVNALPCWSARPAPTRRI